MPESGNQARHTCPGRYRCGPTPTAHIDEDTRTEEVPLLWIVLILLLALAGGFLGTLLKLALWAVVLSVLGFALVGLLIWRAVGSGGGSTQRSSR